MNKDWNPYCETAFNGLRYNSMNWDKPEFARPITRIYYFGVFDAGNPNPTGLISESALKNKMEGKKTVLDHCLSPQFICRMILDNPDIYLSDYEKFKEVYYYSCRTIVVTQEENDALSKLTINDGNTYKVLVPTNLKYNHLGIKLYMRPDSTNKWKLAEEIETNILDVPQELLNYEKDFLV